MVKCLIILSCLLLSAPCFAGSLLEGEWQSDRERTMAFIEAHAVLDDKALDFHRSSFGLLKVRFQAGKVRSYLPDHEVTIRGKVFPMVGFDETHPYSVLYEDEKVAVIRTLSPVSGTPTVAVFNFVSPDVMWIYISGGDGLADLHLREYFTRLRVEG